jgi:hypothetical protein
VYEAPQVQNKGAEIFDLMFLKLTVYCVREPPSEGKKYIRGESGVHSEVGGISLIFGTDFKPSAAREILRQRDVDSEFQTFKLVSR